MVTLKTRFEERMQDLLGKDYDAYRAALETDPSTFIRCNTLKMQPAVLKKRLENRGWTISQPYPRHPEIMAITSALGPGELGRALEHMLGYYYIQDLASMQSAIALMPEAGDLVFDLCAAPGSKTTQLAMMMGNKGTLIGNDVKRDRLAVLSANCQRCGVSNAILTHADGIALCKRFKQHGYTFDKILIDAPCSGEGTIRAAPNQAREWNESMLKGFSRLQKKLVAVAIPLLVDDGILVYSTCTHAPEEDEAVVDFAVKNFAVSVEPIKLPITTRPGITSWGKETFDSSVQNACRIYPQDNNSEGFFVARLRKVNR